MQAPPQIRQRLIRKLAQDLLQLGAPKETMEPLFIEAHHYGMEYIGQARYYVVLIYLLEHLRIERLYLIHE